MNTVSPTSKIPTTNKISFSTMVVASKIKVEECYSSTSLLKRPVPRKVNHVFAKAKAKNQTEPMKEEEPNAKRMRRMSLDNRQTGEIVVVVGGKTFHEDSHTFVSSELIQSAMQVGKREFHFNNAQDPSEWDLVKQLLDPFSDTRISKENLPKALTWFKALKIAKGMTQCDHFLANKVVAVTLPLKRCDRTKLLLMSSVDLEEALDALTLSIRYDLTVSQNKCFEIVRQVLEEGPDWLDLELITKIVSLASSDDKCRTEWMESLTAYIPASARTNTSTIHDLWESALFPVLIRSGVEAKEKERIWKRHTRRLVGKIGDIKDPKRAKVHDLKKALKKDKICRSMIDKVW